MEELRIPIGWGNLAALACGPADGRPVLLLHGWLDNAASFAPLLPLLPKDWRCIALDLAGHGHSDHRPAGTSYNILDAVFDVLAAVDFLKWTRFTSIGHSLGGSVATLLAGAFPERVDTLALIESLGPLSSSAEELPARLHDLYCQIREMPTKRLPVYADLESAARARRTAGAMTEASARRLVERGTRKVEGGYTWRSDPRLRHTTVRITEDQMHAFLKAIVCPTLCILGDQGIVKGLPVWAAREKAVKGITLKELPGAHHLHLDSPEATASLLSAWPPLQAKPSHSRR